MRWSISLWLCAASFAVAGPIDFGLEEWKAAATARNLRGKVKAELFHDPPESFRIEPYPSGGAHITGADLRGLLYGLLEAAEQVRATGRMMPTRGTPAASIRAIRISADGADLAEQPGEFWRGYFQLLARNRFNRVHLVVANPNTVMEPPYRMLRFLSQTATDVGLDFALDLGDGGALVQFPAGELGKLLAACPLIRTLRVEPTVERGLPFYQERVLSALPDAGRLVMLDLRGSPLETEVAAAATAAGNPLLRAFASWPVSFALDPPLTEGRLVPEKHLPFYWVAGRMGYDPKTKPPSGADADEYRAAATAFEEIEAARLAAAGKSTAGEWSYVATAAEAAKNRSTNVPSAKQTPPQTIELLLAAAAKLNQSADADFKALSAKAREAAESLQTAYDREISTEPAAPLAPKAFTRPQMEHKPPAVEPPNQPLTIGLHLTLPKDAPKTGITVRLRYRSLNPAFPFTFMEMPAAPVVTFTIPATDIPSNSDLVYYFEVLNREGGGWFEPGLLLSVPYYRVQILPLAPLIQ